MSPVNVDGFTENFTSLLRLNLLPEKKALIVGLLFFDVGLGFTGGFLSFEEIIL